MQLKDILEEFNVRFFNHPIAFEDVISSDGIRNSYELSYSPICDYDPYKPQVYEMSTGDPMEMQEGADYIMDYEKGLIRFITIPDEMENGVIVRGFFQKCNLYEFINHYNSSIRAMQVTFPVNKLEEVLWHQNISALSTDRVTSLNLEDEPLNKYENILEVYQNKTDKIKVPFIRRDKMVIFTDDHITNPLKIGPGDYGQFVNLELAGVEFPFYVLAEKKYNKILSTSKDMETVIEFDDDAKNQLLLLLGRKMYESWMHKSRSLAVSVLNVQDQMQISNLIQSLDMQLYGDLRNNARYRVVPDNIKQ